MLSVVIGFLCDIAIEGMRFEFLRRLKAFPSFVIATLVYTLALVLIVSALRAQQIVDGHLTINFEYRAF